MIDRDDLLAAAGFVPERMAFPDAWCGHLPFAFWIISTLRPSCFVELGTHSGNSYLGFCQAVVQTGAATRCHAVDTWQGDEHAGKYGEEVINALRSFHDPRFAAFSTLIRSTFDAALENFADGSVDLLHIDGLHTYDAVRHDFESWLPKLAPGALVLFHDTAVRERGFGVWQFWAEMCDRYPGHLEFQHSNGLGVVQIGRSPGRSIPWLNPDTAEQISVQRYFTALGNSMLERYRAGEQAALAAFRGSEIDKHKKWDVRTAAALAEKDIAIVTLRASTAAQLEAARQSVIEHSARSAQLFAQNANLNHDLAKLQTEHQALQQALAVAQQNIGMLMAERDAANSQVLAMRRSTSWRVTAPMRFVQHLARGNFGIARNVLMDASSRAARLLPPRLQNGVRRQRDRILSVAGILPNSSANFAAISDLVALRCAAGRNASKVDPLRPVEPTVWPQIDVGVVTFNNGRWLEGFAASVIALDYPHEKITLRFVDNSSTDDTVSVLRSIEPKLRESGLRVEIVQRPNFGYGAGHNTAIRAGSAQFCLVTNVDLTFEPDALRRIVATALCDEPLAAAWEFRQKPFEHPKYYDPITGSTNWNTAACVLYRRAAIEPLGGFDEALFMYGEDVELSYRLRRSGHLLRYCPQASVWHYSYENDPARVKPIQYSGSTLANLYLRLKYGNLADVLSVPLMAARLLTAPQAFPGARREVLKNLVKLGAKAPKALAARKRSTANFPFRVWDYELGREGAFVKQMPLPPNPPKISVITRTYQGREFLLRQAILSVAHQTWPNIEHIVVEDGGSSMRGLCEEISASTGHSIIFLANEKLGRSSAGNAGLAAASGRWCLFLDDDDLLFCEHLEVLATQLLATPDAVASYSLAWEVVTDLSQICNGHYVELAHNVPAALRQDFDYEVLRHHNFMAIQSVLFERKLFLERGGFDEDMDALEDWILWIRYAYRQRFAYVPKLTSMFRTPSEGAKMRERAEAFGAAYPVALSRAEAWIAKYAQKPPVAHHDQLAAEDSPSVRA